MINKLKVCLVGYGYWGPKLARNFQNSNFFDLTSVSDKSRSNLAKAKKDFPLINISTDFKKLITNNIDLVVIATPTETHFKISKFSLEKKKHILVEKPISLSSTDVIKLQKISRKNKKLIFVDYPFLFSGSINYIKKILENKKFGKLLEVESYREQAPIRKDVNVIWDLCTHDISILTYLLKSKPYSVRTIKKKNIKGPFCDTAYINLKYPNNINVLIKNAWISPTKIRLIKIKFKKAILYCDENESIYKIRIYKNRSGEISNYNLEIPEIDLTEPLSKLASYIHKSIKNNSNKLFQNKFNEKITHLMEKINKAND